LWTAWAAQATRGTLSSRDLTIPTDVLVIANEDAVDYTLVPRLIAAGADLDRVHFVSASTAIGMADSVTIPLDGQRLIDAVRDTHARLVIVDPLVSVLDGKLDSHKDHSIRQALDPLNRVAEVAGAAVIGLVHLNKGGSTDVLDRVLGSRAFTASARSVLAMVEDPEDDSGRQRLVLHAKSNLSERQRAALVITLEPVEVPTAQGVASVGAVRFIGTREVDLADAMTPQTADDAEDLSEAARWLLGHLTDQGGTAPRKDVLAAGKAAGWSDDQMKRAKRRAGVRSSRLDTFPTTAVWNHPAAQSEQSEQLVQLGMARHPTAPTAPDQLEHPVLVSHPTAPTALTAPTVLDLEQETP
jgi:AAA domain